MHNRNRKPKFLRILACASALATGATVAVETSMMPQLIKVKAATNSVAAKSYGVDVASYQNNDLSNMSQSGSQFAIVKVSEGTNYRNPKAAAQITSAINNNMMPMAYHFATFGADTSAAVAEATYAVNSAKALGLPSGSYIACDWEAGQGNNINVGKNPSATAILAFMDQIKAAGYSPLLYSSASWLNNNINTAMINAKYPNALWVASYITMGRIDNPDFAYFPSMDGVAIWQFTDNWRGLNVDGNISLLPLSYNNATTQAPVGNSQQFTQQSNVNKNTTTPTSSSETKTQKTVMHKAYIYNSKGQKVGDKSIGAYNSITVLGGVVQINGKKYYKIGDDEYVVLGNIDGTSRTLKHNSYVYTNSGQRVYVPTLVKGMTISTYGSSIKINGKSYYRINRNRYVKCANF